MLVTPRCWYTTAVPLRRDNNHSAGRTRGRANNGRKTKSREANMQAERMKCRSLAFRTQTPVLPFISPLLLRSPPSLPCADISYPFDTIRRRLEMQTEKPLEQHVCKSTMDSSWCVSGSSITVTESTDGTVFEVLLPANVLNSSDITLIEPQHGAASAVEFEDKGL